jgi:hypothetical protein
MAKSRKTVEIETLLDYANGYLSADYAGGDEPFERARRHGLIDMLEAALNGIGRYRGFSYLDEKVITKSKPGIRWENSGLEPYQLFVDTDPTRRRYA